MIHWNGRACGESNIFSYNKYTAKWVIDRMFFSIAIRWPFFACLIIKIISFIDVDCLCQYCWSLSYDCVISLISIKQITNYHYYSKWLANIIYRGPSAQSMDGDRQFYQVTMRHNSEQVKYEYSSGNVPIPMGTNNSNWEHQKGRSVQLSLSWKLPRRDRKLRISHSHRRWWSLPDSIYRIQTLTFFLYNLGWWNNRGKFNQKPSSHLVAIINQFVAINLLPRIPVKLILRPYILFYPKSPYSVQIYACK